MAQDEYPTDNRGAVFEENKATVYTGKLDVDGHEQQVVVIRTANGADMYTKAAFLGRNQNPKSDRSPQMMGQLTVGATRKFAMLNERRTKKDNSLFYAVSLLEPQEPNSEERPQSASPPAQPASAQVVDMDDPFAGLED